MLEEVCKREGQPEVPCLGVHAHGDDKVLLLDIGQCATLEVYARGRAAAGLRNRVMSPSKVVYPRGLFPRKKPFSYMSRMSAFMQTPPEAQIHLPLVALLRGQLEVLAVPANAGHGTFCLPLPGTRTGIVRDIVLIWSTRVVETCRVAPSWE
jgi:hypothetical protein